MLRLITRDYDANRGEVKLANQNVKDLTKQQLNELITVYQSTFLLVVQSEKSKVGRNDATDEEIGKFLMLVKLEISSMQTGLDTQIAQSAVNLSGGQSKVAIARA